LVWAADVRGGGGVIYSLFRRLPTTRAGAAASSSPPPPGFSLGARVAVAGRRPRAAHPMGAVLGGHCWPATPATAASSAIVWDALRYDALRCTPSTLQTRQPDGQPGSQAEKDGSGRPGAMTSAGGQQRCALGRVDVVALSFPFACACHPARVSAGCWVLSARAARRSPRPRHVLLVVAAGRAGRCGVTIHGTSKSQSHAAKTPRRVANDVTASPCARRVIGPPR
jgi:hypothetical protein